MAAPPPRWHFLLLFTLFFFFGSIPGTYDLLPCLNKQRDFSRFLIDLDNLFSFVAFFRFGYRLLL